MVAKWKKNRRFVLAAAGLCLAMGVFVFLSQRAQRNPPDAVLGARDTVSVTRGTPDLRGKTLSLPAVQAYQGPLMLVDALHPLPDAYVCPDVRSIQAMVGDYVPSREDTLLCPEAIYALCNLQFRYSLTGLAVFHTGAVSAAQLESMRRDAFDRYEKVYPLQEAMARACAAVPAPGESEHQTGYAVDVSLEGPQDMRIENPLCRTAAGRWLCDNLWRFGWIQRFSEKEIKGCEQIHLRYVGVPHAAAMRALGLDLEDYLLLLHREKALTVWVAGAPYAYITCAPEASLPRFTLPEGEQYLFSADNMGYFIVSVSAPGRFFPIEGD